MHEIEELGVPVEVGGIEAGLKELWDQDEARTNASLMNLAVFSEDPASLELNSARIERLTRDHACRAIVIGRDRDASPSAIKAWITAHCHLRNGQKSVCCEQVSFLLQGEAVGRMRNAIFAHLASDLPLVFWWQGELSALFEPALYRRIDRFVFDSSDWADPTEGYAHIEQAVQDQEWIIMQDLAWTRSFHYRHAVAGLFDDLVAQRALPDVNSVRVVAQRKHRTSALLLVAWIARQARWALAPDLGRAPERAPGEGECFTFESTEGTHIAVQVEWEDEGCPLSLLEMEAPGCLVTVEHRRDESFLRHRLQCPKHELESRGPADGATQVDLLADQLSRGGKNRLFSKVRPLFLELLAL